MLAVAAKVVLSRFVATGHGQSRAVPDSHLEPGMQLFHAVVTVMAKWLYQEYSTIPGYTLNQPMAI